MGSIRLRAGRLVVAIKRVVGGVERANVESFQL
jgi:hypothetical protein